MVTETDSLAPLSDLLALLKLLQAFTREGKLCNYALEGERRKGEGRGEGEGEGEREEGGGRKRGGGIPK